MFLWYIFFLALFLSINPWPWWLAILIAAVIVFGCWGLWRGINEFLYGKWLDNWLNEDEESEPTDVLN